VPAPRRYQQRRTKGWRKPEGAVAVGRPSRWSNPFRVGRPATTPRGELVVRDRAHAVELFAAYLANEPDLQAEVRAHLRGRDLMCWCPLDGPCHADVLLRVANDE
jgi:hypothetical protein